LFGRTFSATFVKKSCSSSVTTDVCMYVVTVNSFVCFSVALLEHKLFLGSEVVKRNFLVTEV